MAPLSRSQRGRGDSAGSTRPTVAAWVGYGVIALVFAGFVGSRLARPADSYWTWLDGWVVDGIELGGSLLCLARGLLWRRRRPAVLTLGLALLSWWAGDLVTTLESLRGATPPQLSWADVFYLGFYPLAYTAIVLFLRGELKGPDAPSWLDGVVAGLGAASVCAGFVFRRVLAITGAGMTSTITGLAYPVGDLLLLGLVIGGATMVSSGRRRSWMLLALGCAVNISGDTSNLLERSASAATAFSDAVAWPASILLMSAAVWLPTARAGLFRPYRRTAALVPQLGAACALGILFAGTLRPMNRFALVLATASLSAAGVRLALSLRSLRTLSEERHRQSVTDELTGLANRRQLFGVLDGFFAEYGEDSRPDRQLAFLFVDLDDFKEINDSFGHPCGDELLRQLGPRFAGCLRGSDLMVRLGGDEFAVLLVDGDTGYAVEVAQRLTDSLEQAFDLGELTVKVSASIGIAVAPAQASDSASLLSCADVAMYRAKGQRSPFAVFERDLDLEGRLRSASELRAAIDKGHLVLHYQPQLDLRSGEITGVEALVRWAHPRLGLLPPQRFLPVAEDAGLMRAVTNFVLEEALSQCAAWRCAGYPLVVSVNVSPTNLLEAGFTDFVRHVLRRHDLPAEVLVVEVTETCVITQFERSRLVIEELRDLGAVVSIDDFGAGFTSLAYLGSLAVGELKLDRAFVTELDATGRGRDSDLLRATIELAHTMHLRVVVEGIEDRATLDLVAGFGCELVQGYFICRPKPADDIPGWISRREWRTPLKLGAAGSTS